MRCHSEGELAARRGVRKHSRLSQARSYPQTRVLIVVRRPGFTAQNFNVLDSRVIILVPIPRVGKFVDL